MPDSKSRARKIKLLLFDVDGVLTDGKLFFVPTAVGGKNERAGELNLTSQGSIEIKGFHAHDGVAISLARVAGIKTGLITKRASETVAVRARDLKLDHIYQGIQDKQGAFREILKKEGLKPSEACFVGDDVIDLPVMWNCGLAVAVANAREDVKKDAHYVTKHAGGDGALRDTVEFILKSQGRLKKVVEKYVGCRKQKERKPVSLAKNASARSFKLKASG
jgi:3-deoxy-D-manno-octulosonate 8-phosphate phosphatase (KDO 8-P phosphatase)